ncbi:hypothetical protein DFH09DRAFT_1086569 [Mycena vulgaris]|nr:hypothetical protein DFH09DRAFT_1086569 [Mycena vulgaris]
MHTLSSADTAPPQGVKSVPAGSAPALPKPTLRFVGIPPSLSAVGTGSFSYLPRHGTMPTGWSIPGAQPASVVSSRPALFAPGSSIKELAASGPLPGPNHAAASSAVIPPATQWTSYSFKNPAAAVAVGGGGGPPRGGPPLLLGYPAGPGTPNSLAPPPGNSGGRGSSSDSGGGGGGGGDRSGGGGGGGPPEGGGPPSGDPGGLNSWNQDWQLNRKLNLNMVPEWDGRCKTAISYLCKIAELVRLSLQMVTNLGAMVPLKFTGRAEMWWTTQILEVRNYVSQRACSSKRTTRTSSMSYGGRNITVNTKKCVSANAATIMNGHSIFFNAVDGAEVVDDILRTAPVVDKLAK